MSNPNSPFGFLPVGVSPGSATPSFGLVTKRILYSNATAIYRGDPVKLLSTGYIAQWTQGTAASQLCGIFWGCSYLSTAQGKTVNNSYWPGSDVSSTAAYATAYILPCIGSGQPPLFKVQSDSTQIAFADIGQNVDVTVGTGTVAGVYGKSGASLAYATLNTTVTLPFRVVDLYSSSMPSGTPGTDDTSSYNIAIVQANINGETGI